MKIFITLFFEVPVKAGEHFASQPFVCNRACCHKTFFVKILSIHVSYVNFKGIGNDILRITEAHEIYINMVQQFVKNVIISL